MQPSEYIEAIKAKGLKPEILKDGSITVEIPLSPIGKCPKCGSDIYPTGDGLHKACSRSGSAGCDYFE